MKRWFAIVLAAALAGCGFQLREAAKLPFDTVYVPGSGGIALDLKRNIRAGTHATVVDNAKQAQAVMQFTREERQKVILSLTATGRVREFQLRYIVGFRVVDNKGHCGTSAAMADTLFNGHCGRKPGNQINFRPFQDLHVLTYKKRQTFQITALSLGKKDVKGQGGFA